MNDTILRKLLEAAWAVRENAYAPYSNFKVGAALLSTSGEIFCGCNVENLSYGLTICAERNAVFAAAARGIREFTGAVVVADTDQPISPCGACRQVLAEFGNFEIVCANHTSTFRASLEELLPRSRTGILNQ